MAERRSGGPGARRRWFKDATGGSRTTVAVTLRPTREDHERLERVARAYGMTVEDLAARAVTYGLERLIGEARAAGLDV